MTSSPSVKRPPPPLRPNPAPPGRLSAATRAILAAARWRSSIPATSPGPSPPARACSSHRSLTPPAGSTSARRTIISTLSNRMAACCGNMKPARSSIPLARSLTPNQGAVRRRWSSFLGMAICTVFRLDEAISNPADRLLWKYTAELRPGVSFNRWFEGNVAVGPDGTLYAGNTNFLYYAITPTGQLKWTYPTTSNNWSLAAFGRRTARFTGARTTRLSGRSRQPAARCGPPERWALSPLRPRWGPTIRCTSAHSTATCTRSTRRPAPCAGNSPPRITSIRPPPSRRGQLRPYQCNLCGVRRRLAVRGQPRRSSALALRHGRPDPLLASGGACAGQYRRGGLLWQRQRQAVCAQRCRRQPALVLRYHPYGPRAPGPQRLERLPSAGQDGHLHRQRGWRPGLRALRLLPARHPTRAVSTTAGRPRRPREPGLCHRSGLDGSALCHPRGAAP